MDGWKTAFLLGWPIFERYMLGSVPLSAIVWVFGAFWSGSFLVTSLRNVSEKGLPRAMFLGGFFRYETWRFGISLDVWFLGIPLISRKQKEIKGGWNDEKSWCHQQWLDKFLAKLFGTSWGVSRQTGILVIPKKTPTYPWNIPQTLNHLFMKVCFGLPGVCSRCFVGDFS